MTAAAWILAAILTYAVGVIVTGRIVYRRALLADRQVHLFSSAQDEALREAASPALLWFLFWPFIGVQALWTWHNNPTSKDPT